MLPDMIEGGIVICNDIPVHYQKEYNKNENWSVN